MLLLVLFALGLANLSLGAPVPSPYPSPLLERVGEFTRWAPRSFPDGGLRARASANTSDWMGMHQAQLGHLSLRELLLPGSHDSGAYELTTALAPAISGSDDMNALIELAEQLGLPVNAIITPWALSQRGSVLEQLEAGIRYIDLRICWNGTHFLTYHFETGNTIATLLDDMTQFVKEHPKELLVVEAQLWQPDNRTSNHTVPAAAKRLLGQMLVSAFPGMLYPQQPRMDTPYSTLLAQGQRVLVTVDDALVLEAGGVDSTGAPWLWPGSQAAWDTGVIWNTYANNSTLGVMEAFNTRQVQIFNSPLLSSNGARRLHRRFADPDPPLPARCKRLASGAQASPPCLFKLSWTLTTDLSAIYLSLIDPTAPRSLIDMADRANEAFFAWLNNSAAAAELGGGGTGELPSLGRILIADDVTNPNCTIVQAAIQINLQAAEEGARRRAKATGPPLSRPPSRLIADA